MPRPKLITEKTRLRIAPEGRSRLQKNSARRAVVDFMIEAGGVATLKEINERFGYDISGTVKDLIRVKWVQVVETD